MARVKAPATCVETGRWSSAGIQAGPGATRCAEGGARVDIGSGRATLLRAARGGFEAWELAFGEFPVSRLLKVVKGAIGFDGWSKAGAACRGCHVLVNQVALLVAITADDNYAIAA